MTNKGNLAIVAVVLAVVILIVWVRISGDNSTATVADTDSELITTRGIHWHPHLSISVRGEEVEIPANIGLIGGHNPMHTHDTDGIIHLEFESVVRKEHITLGRFFDLWGKTFNEDQLFNNKNTETERVHMFVNGEENTEFGDYVLQHEDEIEIRYE